MFINHTNHPSSRWNHAQLSEALKWGGTITDIPFPDIDPFCTDQELNEKVENNIKAIASLNPKAVLCQGEFVYSYRMIQRLKEKNIPVLAACSQRKVVECVQEDGTTKKESVFEFVGFRLY